LGSEIYVGAAVTLQLISLAVLPHLNGLFPRRSFLCQAVPSKQVREFEKRTSDLVYVDYRVPRFTQVRHVAKFSFFRAAVVSPDKWKIKLYDVVATYQTRAIEFQQQTLERRSAVLSDAVSPTRETLYFRRLRVAPLAIPSEKHQWRDRAGARTRALHPFRLHTPLFLVCRIGLTVKEHDLALHVGEATSGKRRSNLSNSGILI
jgi:hypothetical protein